MNPGGQRRPRLWRRRGPAAWTARDAALWHTCDVLDALATDRVDLLAPVATTFPASIGAGERFLATAPYTLAEFFPLGDGSYRRVQGGRMGGLPAAVGNARRRSAAAAAATPRWNPVESGWLFLSTHGFYLAGSGIRPWPWTDVTAATMTAPGAVHLYGESAAGAVSWTVHSDYAELLFAVWARTRHPDHPQLAAAAWLPPDWSERAAAHLGTVPDSLADLPSET